MFDPQPIRIDTDELKAAISRLQYKLYTGRWITLLLVVVFASGGWAWKMMSAPAYVAKCTFVLEEKSGGGGALSGLASQFGFDLGALSGGSDNFFSGENINDIIASSAIMEEVLLSRTNDSITLADRFLDASGMRDAMGWGGRLTSFLFVHVPRSAEEQRLFDTALLVVGERIREKHLIIDKTNKKGTIFGVEVKSRDPEFAKLLTERLVSGTSKMYIDIKTRNLTDNISKLEKRADSLRQLFGSKSRQTFSLQILDANEAYKSNLASADISQRDKSVLFELYAEVMKNLEVSRMMLINQMPVIQVLDRPQDLLVDTRPGTLFVVLLCILLGALLGSLLTLLRN